MDENRIATRVIGAAIEVHRKLGPGMLESTYQQCLAHELRLRGIPFEAEKPVGLDYKGLQIENAYRADFLVGGKLIVELKSVEEIMPIHKAQVLTYLRWSACRLGLLLNFNASLLRTGIHRIANRL